MTLKIIVHFFVFLITAIQLVSILLLDGNYWIAAFFVPVLYFFRLRFLTRASFKKNLCMLMVFFYYELSLSISPLIEYFYDPETLSIELVWKLFFIDFIILFLIQWVDRGIFFIKEKDELAFQGKESALVKLSILVFIGSLVLSFIAYKLKVGVMGLPAPNLKFKLEPMINLARTIIIPVLFNFIIFLQFKIKSGKSFYLTLFFYFLWACLEMQLRGSRGVVFFAFLPVLFMFLKELNWKKSFVYLSIFFFISLVGYFIGNYSRTCYHGKCEVLRLSSGPIHQIYTRLFNEVRIFINIEKATNENIGTPQFYFENKGAVKINTHIIDKVPVDRTHSSGITALSDGLLFFSHWGVFITILVLILIAYFIDDLVNKKRLPAYMHPLLTWFLFEKIFLGDGFWSYYIFRSWMTISVFPLALFLTYGLFKFNCSARSGDCLKASK